MILSGNNTDNKVDDNVECCLDNYCDKSITIYVNCNNSSTKQTGKSWQHAYSSLQTALDHASMAYGKVYICIAKGTYFPTKIYSPNNQTGGASKSDDLRLRTFNIPNRTTLVGGFNGTEATRKECDAEANVTILSGLNKYWHVVTVGNDINTTFTVNCSLHNLTITGGNAQGPSAGSLITQPVTYQHTCGGGLYIVHGSNVKLHKVSVVDNNCGITDPLDSNKTVGGNGGGIFCSNSNLLMDKCTVSNNTAEFRGAGLQVFSSYEGEKHHKTLVRNCVFNNNKSAVYGGGFNATAVNKNKLSTVVFECCQFDNNSAQIGGGCQLNYHDVDFESCDFNNNFAAISGGGLSSINVLTFNGLYTKGVVNVTSCEFTDNVAGGNKELAHEVAMSTEDGLIRPQLGGGAIGVYRDGHVNITKSVFNNNTAQNGDGGAVLNGRQEAQLGNQPDFSFTSILECKFRSNTALLGNGGAIASVGTSTRLVVRDAKFKNNKAPNGTGDNIYYSSSFSK